MRVLAWLADGTWEACVDAVRDLGTPGRDIETSLLYVVDADVMAAMSGPIGLLGRGAGTPGEMLADAGAAVLAAAAERLGDGERLLRRGRPEDVVVDACAEADLLVVARDGDLSHRGPHSLGHATRFVVDHAPCGVLLVWPRATTPSRH